MNNIQKFLLELGKGFAFTERLSVMEGDVIDVIQNARGFYVTVAFDE